MKDFLVVLCLMIIIFNEINYYQTTKRLKEIEAKCDELIIKIKECES